uniref:Uncharacterized protein n=1 Tax=Palpitomonas bilix TaxID=652834 RepID=A0A7S3GF51_9EUKA|eukprot:CAMPEP_0113909866 /NCGR_PEP_ID=MMETSP0780_2-20120614/27130_1 /TAXON_ID=652834 /ORGANISM="Palpitomonas bilix" /LENGTH=268 /DNA_ID=CAMNT_0000905803 /DNA_START=668 /DNA_END=1474 /DNA_ORIENTATION=+ /assembly_acc=CAM_ASM_000599
MDVYSGLNIIVKDPTSMRERVKATLGTENFKVYWKLFDSFMQFKLTKKEFDIEVIALFGDDKVHVHNAFIRGILANAMGGAMGLPADEDEKLKLPDAKRRRKEKPVSQQRVASRLPFESVAPSSVKESTAEDDAYFNEAHQKYEDAKSSFARVAPFDYLYWNVDIPDEKDIRASMVEVARDMAGIGKVSDDAVKRVAEATNEMLRSFLRVVFKQTKSSRLRYTTDEVDPVAPRHLLALLEQDPALLGPLSAEMKEKLLISEALVNHPS